MADCEGNAQTHKFDSRFTSIGCTRDEAANDMFDRILIAVEDERKVKCEEQTCVEGDSVDCVTEIANSADIEGALVCTRIRLKRCDKTRFVGWKCVWSGGTVESRCTCVI